MASQIGRDVTIWLTSKLEEPWSSQKITSYITSDFLQNIKPRFSTLDTAIKTRFLLSFVNLKKKTLLELEKDITDILQIAQQDEDEWVQVMAKILSAISKEKQIFDADLLNNEVFQNMRTDLSQELTQFGELQFCPLEYLYLSNKLIPTLPSVLTTNTHFKLKKPPVISNKVSTTPSTPRRKPLNVLALEDQIDVSNHRSISKPIKTPNTPPQPNTPTLPSNGSTRSAPAPKSSDSQSFKKEKRKMLLMDISEVTALQVKKKEEEERKKKSKEEKKEDEKEEGEEGSKEALAMEADKKDPNAAAEAEKKKERKRKKKEEEANQDPNQPKEKKERKKKEEDPNKPKKPRKKKEENSAEVSPTLNGGIPIQTSPSKEIQSPRPVQRTATMLLPGFTPQVGLSSLPFKLPTTPTGTEMNLNSLLAATLSQNPGMPGMMPFMPRPASPNVNLTGLPLKSPDMSAPPAPQPMQPASQIITADTLLENCNRLTQENRRNILAFLSGNRVNPNPLAGPQQQILLNYEEKQNQETRFAELLVFEINYDTGTWRKLRRKKPLDAFGNSAPPTPQQSPPPTLPLQQ